MSFVVGCLQLFDLRQGVLALQDPPALHDLVHLLVHLCHFEEAFGAALVLQELDVVQEFGQVGARQHHLVVVGVVAQPTLPDLELPDSQVGLGVLLLVSDRLVKNVHSYNISLRNYTPQALQKSSPVFGCVAQFHPD